MHLPLSRSVVRSWTLADVSDLAKNASNQAIFANVRDLFPYPYTEEDALAWVQYATTCSPETHFAIARRDEKGGELAIGGIGIELGLDVHRRSAEIGYWLGEPYWGKGIASEALRGVTAWAFENFDILRVHALVFDWNPASTRVLEKAGYSFEGRLKKYITKGSRVGDALVYAQVR